LSALAADLASAKWQKHEQALSDYARATATAPVHREHHVAGGQVMYPMLSAIAAFLLGVLPTVSLGQTSEEYVAMGQKLWAAFECGALAEYADKPEESGRLYKMGYDEGKTLLDAFRAGKIDDQAKRKLPPPVLFMLDGGPTVDFILGRIFESAMQNTSQQLLEATNNKETRKIIAGRNFAKRNCGLL
jgi:hypothetical protein